MTLGTLIDGLAGARLIGDPGTPVRAVRSDSREIEPGDVYVAVRGRRADGHAFVPAAIARGAAAVVVEHPVDAAVPQVIVPDGAVALGVLVSRALGDPAHAMTLVGITGTNGKTTTTFLVESILAAAGARPGVVGTVDYRWRDASGARRRAEAPYTTPTPQVLHETLAAMRADGTSHVVMEVSSFALSMARVAGMTFAVGAFSNLTQDHLDVHGSMAEYRAAKRRLFSHHLVDHSGDRSGGPAGTAVVNIDDPEGEAMAQAAPGRVLRVSADGRPADIRVIEQRSTVRGIRARIATPRGELTVESRPLIGHYNVANLALAVGIGEALGLPHEAIARGIADLPGVPGRVERVPNAADLDIFVDYAHTPDALRNVLTALRPLTRRRLICVFGCGGDRDPTKRPAMGAQVAELADLAVVTSDNPRTEDPRAIIDQILAGIPRPFAVDPDRARAIRAAISEAVPGDVVLIAGKGHEDYQIVGTAKHHFDDREQAAAAVGARAMRRVGELARDAQGELTGDAGTAIHRVVIDSRIAAPRDLYVAIRGETHDGHAFCRAAVDAGAAAVMIERSGAGGRAPRGIEHTVEVAAPAIIVPDTRIALGALAREHRRRWPGRLVAITGSAGKTTTKELIRAALALAGPTHTADGSLNNETGVPLTVLGLRPFHAFGVVEMGMRGAGQIEYLTRIAEPDVALVVNAGTAHIELLGSTDAIAVAKAEIWLGLREGGTIVRPADDDRLAALATRHRPDALQLTFGERDADVELVGYRATDTGSDLEISVAGRRHRLQLGLVGKHVALDACAALAAAIAAAHHVRTDGYSVSGVTELIAVIGRLIRGLGHARPAAMRGEIVEVAGRKLIVDCYNANPASMAAALRALAERGHGPAPGAATPHSPPTSAVAVIGDMLELGDHAAAAHREIGELARELGVGVVALGPLAAVAAECAGGETAAAPADAAARALARTRPGDWILLKASRGMRLERVLDELRAIERSEMGGGDPAGSAGGAGGEAPRGIDARTRRPTGEPT